MDTDFDVWPLFDFSDFADDAQICGNCQHWGREQLQTLRLKTATGLALWEVAPCLRDAVEPDAGQNALVLLSEDSNCRQHADLFEPSLEFFLEHSPVHHPSHNPPHSFRPVVQSPPQTNAVLPGRDFPASLAHPKPAN